MKRRAFSIVELLVVITIVVILVGLLLPAIQVSRSGVARPSCQNKLRQIVLAMTNFYLAHQKFPSAIGYRYDDPVGSSGQLSAFVQILPYMDQAGTYEQITEGCTIRSTSYAPCPPLDTAGFDPWEIQNPMFVCSSVPEIETRFAVTHYALSIGDRARNIASAESPRGAFGGSQRLSYNEFEDGMSNTIMAAEIGARTYETRKNQYAIDQPALILESPVVCFDLVDSNNSDWQFNKGVSLSSMSRGGHWADGRAGPALFNTILPPNSPSVSVGNIGADGIYSASSSHEGGLNVARADGSIFFLEENVDAGDSSNPTPTEAEMAAKAESPYGVWGALGTINDGVILDAF